MDELNTSTPSTSPQSLPALSDGVSVAPETTHPLMPDLASTPGVDTAGDGLFEIFGTGGDPFDLLLNASSDSRILFLLGAPAALLLLISLVYAVIIIIRNRRERREMERHLAEVESGTLTDDGEDDEADDGVKPYDVPKELLSDDEKAARHLRLIKSEPARELRQDGDAPLVATDRLAPAPSALRPADIDEIRTTDRGAWRVRLTAGLSKARDALRHSLSGVFTGKTKIDASVLDKLHEALYRADIGVATADRLVDAVRTRLGKADAADWDQVASCLKEAAREILEQQPAPALQRPAHGPWVVLIVGVNGVGKTTTIGKLAAHHLAADQKVLLAAADTFRAAAIDQLKVWGNRLGVDVIAHQPGSDPAAVAYDAVKAAVSRQVDTVLIDTAGRLHSKTELMAELSKIKRVIGRDVPEAPHETWLVLDATTGQNAVAQVKAFREVAPLTGLVITKLDGTAKGGVVIGIADQFKLPIRYIGVGEKAADLRAFDAGDFVESLF